ncbi:MAG: glycosyltransferase [Chloroflexi bacterium]|nr:glycosyltransferase [Chloroflexota bacterium]
MSTQQSRARVSLVTTVLNEAPSIGDLLASVDAQTRSPDEVIFVDGGSTDATLDVLYAWANQRDFVQVTRAPGSSIAQGRNLGISQATGEVVAVTDAGVTLDPAWLEHLVETLEADPEVQVAAGFFVPDDRSDFDRAMAATVLPRVEEIDGQTFLPSSRSVAFRRAAWERVGGYPEWLDYCEDLVFDLELKRAGLRFAWVPSALVRFRTRPDLLSFFVQYYRYARGDGKADLWRKRHAIRYAAYFLAALVAVRPTLPGLAVMALGGAWYLRRPLWRFLLLGPVDVRAGLVAFGLIPVIRLTGDIAKMVGYPVGVAWRLRHGPQGRHDR